MNKNHTPTQLVGPNGLPSFGIFPHSVEQINGRDTDYRTPMGAKANKLARHFHYKQFQYFGVIHDDYLIGCALAHTAWLGVAFFYIFDPKTQQLESYTWRSPLGLHMQLSNSPVQGCSHFKQGPVHIEMGYRQRQQGLEKSLSVTLPHLSLDISMQESSTYEPMSLCTRTGINGWVYANKVAGTPVVGVLRQGNQNTDIRAFGHHDFSAGYMRRQTFWNWACFSGEAKGLRLGLNVSCGVNETSFSENCFWLDDACVPLGPIVFDYQRHNLEAPWQISTHDNSLMLTFHPLGKHTERLNLGLFASNFNQMFGYFSGHLTLPDGNKLSIERLHGFVEEQYAKW